MIPAHVWSMTLRIRRHDNADAIVELIAGHLSAPFIDP
jgi:hypothetical protein